MTPAPSAPPAILETLEARFRANAHRHPGLDWANVRARLEADPGKLRTLEALEETGGEPDVVGIDAATGAFVFVDCARETPAGRRSLCYDEEARLARKKFPPEGSAEEEARRMGAALLTEEEYHYLQSLGPVDTKTSSWLRTPDDVRARGGAVFGDHRFGRTWIYHNGADSYYAARGFRCLVRV